MAKSRGRNAHQEFMERREREFNLGNVQNVQLKEYNALHDPNMRHFFEARHNQYLLYRTGQIDSHGRVIDLEKNKSKLHILEREFKEAERVEQQRQREEIEMRYRVQRKRFNELERAKKSEILEKLKAERELSKEIVNTLRMSATGGFDASQTLKTRGSSTKGSSKGTSKGVRSKGTEQGGFFVTDGNMS